MHHFFQVSQKDEGYLFASKGEVPCDSHIKVGICDRLFFRIFPLIWLFVAYMPHDRQLSAILKLIKHQIKQVLISQSMPSGQFLSDLRLNMDIVDIYC